MILSGSLFTVCFSVAFRALSYIFSSGSGDGAIDILLLLFLQAKLPASGISKWWLGFTLLFMEMGGIVGSRLILKVPKIRYKWIFAISLLFVLTGLLTEHSGVCWIMTFGGFIAAIGDDALQVRTNAILQELRNAMSTNRRFVRRGYFALRG